MHSWQLIIFKVNLAESEIPWMHFWGLKWVNLGVIKEAPNAPSTYFQHEHYLSSTISAVQCLILGHMTVWSLTFFCQFCIPMIMTIFCRHRALKITRRDVFVFKKIMTKKKLKNSLTFCCCWGNPLLLWSSVICTAVFDNFCLFWTTEQV